MKPIEDIPLIPPSELINRQPRLPCLVLADTSTSMQGEPIDELNRGIDLLRDEIAEDKLACASVELSVVSFATEVEVVQPFSRVTDYKAPHLASHGVTAMGTAIDRALDLLVERQRFYREQGLPEYRPWVFLLTDGQPLGEPPERIRNAAARVHQMELANELSFFTVGIRGANFELLSNVSPRAPLALKGLEFQGLFRFISLNAARRSTSRPDEPFTMVLPPEAPSCFLNA